MLFFSKDKDEINFFLGKYVFSCPFFQMGKEILSNSAKDIEYEKKRMEYVLEKQKRLQVEQKSNFKI
jgi:hypothetical protein